jgi:hypothetical protein
MVLRRRIDVPINSKAAIRRNARFAGSGTPMLDFFSDAVADGHSVPALCDTGVPRTLNPRGAMVNYL